MDARKITFTPVDTKLDGYMPQYLMAKYEVTSMGSLEDAAWNIAVGQSVGNPSVRSPYETEEMFEQWGVKVQSINLNMGFTLTGVDYQQGEIVLAFPIQNFVDGGISQMVCHLMGGHVDIDTIKTCRLVDIWFNGDEGLNDFVYGNHPQICLQNRFGIRYMRNIYNQNRPFVGAILKPKIGLSVDEHVDVISQLVDGGVDFIKEDEIMAENSKCPLGRRVYRVANHLSRQSRKVVVCHTINGDYDQLYRNAKIVRENGGNGVHLNIWGGLGAYRFIRKEFPDLFIHFQKSGDRVITNKSNPYSISWYVFAKIAAWMGVDSIQMGMIGGYSSDDPEEMIRVQKMLVEYNVVPALSCGMHPGLVDAITNKLGNVDWMANSGGAVHGHPGGSKRGAQAMYEAVTGIHGEAYHQAIEKWGYVECLN